MRTITISRYVSMPWRWLVKHAEPGKHPFSRDAKDAGEAAAVAVNFIQCGKISDYVIIGAKEALDLIPESIRSGKRQ
jgi:hypothetical protein